MHSILILIILTFSRCCSFYRCLPLCAFFLFEWIFSFPGGKKSIYCFFVCIGSRSSKPKPNAMHLMRYSSILRWWKQCTHTEQKYNLLVRCDANNNNNKKTWVLRIEKFIHFIYGRKKQQQHRQQQTKTVEYEVDNDEKKRKKLLDKWALIANAHYNKLRNALFFLSWSHFSIYWKLHFQLNFNILHHFSI